MIWAELKKMKRHYLLPLSIGVVVLSSLLALFQLIGATNSVVWLSAADRWNPLEQPNPYISISDNLFWRFFDESGIL